MVLVSLMPPSPLLLMLKLSLLPQSQGVWKAVVDVNVVLLIAFGAFLWGFFG